MCVNHRFRPAQQHFILELIWTCPAHTAGIPVRPLRPMKSVSKARSTSASIPEQPRPTFIWQWHMDPTVLGPTCQWNCRDPTCQSNAPASGPSSSPTPPPHPLARKKREKKTREKTEWKIKPAYRERGTAKDHACHPSTLVGFPDRRREPPTPPQPWFADRSGSWPRAPSPSPGNGSTSSSAASTSTSTRCSCNPLHQIPQIPAPYSVRFLRVFFFGVFDLGAWANALGFVDVWVSQGAELMGKYGINVPRGAAAGSVEEVKNTLKNVFPSEKEVMFPFLILYCLCGQFETWLWQLFDGIRMYIENVVYCNFCWWPDQFFSRGEVSGCCSIRDIVSYNTNGWNTSLLVPGK